MDDAGSIRVQYTKNLHYFSAPFQKKWQRLTSHVSKPQSVEFDILR